MKLGNDIKRCRFDHDTISQQALANAVGVTRLTIHSIEKRKNIVKKIYNLPGNATESDVETLFNVHKDVYIVTRENTDINNFKRIDFIEIFQSGGGTYRVYQRKTDKK